MLKTSLHIHIHGDRDDYIRYNGFELLDHAHTLGFDVIAFTCHERVVITQELKDHAHSLGILLIPGIELNLGGHVLVLNADPEAQSLKTLEDLRKYRETHSDIFVIAAHPFFPSWSPLNPTKKLCLKEKLLENIKLFDAIEYSWFYSKWIDWNKKAKIVAEKNGLPYLATSDVHLLEMLNNGHVLIEAERNIESIFEALKAKQFVSVSKPQGVFRMWWTFAKMNLNQFYKYLPWAPPHTVFEHAILPPENKSESERKPKTDRISGSF